LILFYASVITAAVGIKYYSEQTRQYMSNIRFNIRYKYSGGLEVGRLQITSFSVKISEMNMRDYLLVADPSFWLYSDQRIPAQN